MTMTLSAALARHNLTVADELLASIEVPVLCGPQRQGDVLILPRPKLGKAEQAAMVDVPATGVNVVRGEATGNAHILDRVQGVVRWAAHRGAVDDLLLGVLEVGDGSVAHLIHTDEHGCNAVGPGVYVLHGKREQAEEIRRVAD